MKALSTVSAPTQHRGANTYTPPAAINVVEGVLVNGGDGPAGLEPVDHYYGTMEQLVASGLASADMFPGQPGRPTTKVAYRPAGAIRGAGQPWHTVAGYMTIQRHVSGVFTISVTVAEAEQRRRAQERDRRTQPRALAVGRGHVDLGEGALVLIEGLRFTLDAVAGVDRAKVAALLDDLQAEFSAAQRLGGGARLH